MKPRVLLSWSDYRIGMSGEIPFVERSDGRDNLGVTRWREMTDEEWRANARDIMRSLARALRRRARIAKARRDAGRRR